MKLKKWVCVLLAVFLLAGLFCMPALAAADDVADAVEQTWGDASEQIKTVVDSVVFPALGMVLGTMVLYALGTAWLAYSAGMDFQAALWAGVIPFIPGDLVKMVIAVLLGSAVRGRLLRAGILEGNN